MYSGSGFSDWEIGDITVIINKGIYHLFHLIIPNHDYIAHAVSDDGISWKRTNNALFVGNPGEWDDDMLWTMHVCEVNAKFEMYYTGLKRKDRGVVSRIGLAESDNLLDWKKNTKNNIFPIEPKGIYYETGTTNPRTWLSFRDPFRFEYKGEVYLLLASRVLQGPVSRRGCVGLVKITNDVVALMPPLFNPMVYDDIEWPCVFELHGRFYLLGSIREDIKVRYWFAPDFFGEYHSFHADVLLPQGNYAARIVEDGEHMLIYNFFYAGKIDALRVLPPPKQLDTDDKGRLVLKTYYRWQQMVTSVITQEAMQHPKHLFNNPTSNSTINEQMWVVNARSGYEIFCIDQPGTAFIWEGILTVEGLGKFGLVCDMDNEGNGYYISFNIISGEVKIRSWGFNPLNYKQNFIFNDIQNNFFVPSANRSFHFCLIRYGHYIELAVGHQVKLTLMDYTYSGKNIGIYSASSVISLQQSVLKTLTEPLEEYASQEEAQTIP